jgi:hypothetical protein
MNFKPSDFFIGLVDFFSILLPGAILTYLQLDFLNMLLNGVFNNEESTKFTFAFLISSFVIGHFVYALGSLLDIYFYDGVRKLFYPTKLDMAYTDATSIKKNFSKENVSDSVNTFKWAKSVIQIKNPEMIHAINKLEADQKFFRSFAIVALIILVPNVIHWDSFQVFSWFAILFLSLWRYVNRRFNCTKLAYENIVTMKSIGQLDNPSQI